MAALLYKDPITDPSKNATAVLDFVLQDTAPEMLAKKTASSSVTQELHQAPLVEEITNRQQSRVLFITSDVGALQEDSMLQLHFKNLADVFAEIHIIVLADGAHTKKEVTRLSATIWTYTTSELHTWGHVSSALEIARAQLCFADGFRPDIVVALDPFESGLAGLYIARMYQRALQVHLLDDFFLPTFTQREKHPRVKRLIASYVLKRTMSIRTATTTLLEKIQKKMKHTKDVALLPRHYDIQALITVSHTPIVADAFPQFLFMVLFVGDLNHESTLFRAIDAAQSILYSKSIGLVVLGDGPAKKEFQKRAEILGVHEQVVFVKDQSQLMTCLQSADVLLCTDTTEESDELVIKAAACGLPIIVASTPLRDDLFTDGVDAFLCPKDDTVSFSQKLVKFLNTNALRLQFATNAQEVVKARLHEDPVAYKTAYKDSIESIFSHDV